MNKKIDTGQWVEIKIVLIPGPSRAAKLSPDTQAVNLTARIKGFFIHDACVGEEVIILTILGRKINGRLIAINPISKATFGVPASEILSIGAELKSFMGNVDKEDQ